MYRINFELRYDDGRVVKSFENQCGTSEVSDVTYDRLLACFCQTNDVELHLISVSLGPDFIVRVFPSSLSPSSVEC